MKLVINIGLCALLAAGMCAIIQAQDQSGTQQKQADLWKLELSQFNRLDSAVRPITDQEVQDFCDLFRKIPIEYQSQEQEKLTISKIRSARLLHGECKSPDQKKRIVAVMMEMFPRIQAIRDTLGVNPLSKTESYLYVDPPSPPVKEGLTPPEKMLEQQRVQGERMTKRNQLSAAIGRLEFIHGYLHRDLTKFMKIPVEGISPVLERSPEEKARTREMLEKQAAEHGQFPPRKREGEQDAPPR